MASRLELEYRDRDPEDAWHVPHKIFHTIAAYVQPDSPASAAETAAALDAISPVKRRLDPGEIAEWPWAFLDEFWDTFLSLAQQVPYDHPSQERLVELVQELPKLPSKPVLVCT